MLVLILSVSVSEVEWVSWADMVAVGCWQPGVVEEEEVK